MEESTGGKVTTNKILILSILIARKLECLYRTGN